LAFKVSRDEPNNRLDWLERKIPHERLDNKLSSSIPWRLADSFHATILAMGARTFPTKE
jgi:hypothetical protein